MQLVLLRPRLLLAARHIQVQVIEVPKHSRMIATEASAKAKISLFLRFITENADDSYCYQLFYTSFQEFFAKHVCKYADYQTKPVSFVGSIAHYNQDILKKAAEDMGIQVHLIMESPIQGLIRYHKNE